jgi:hypothetical protein
MSILTSRDLEFLASLPTCWRRLYPSEIERLLQEDSKSQTGFTSVNESTSEARTVKTKIFLTVSAAMPWPLSLMMMLPSATSMSMTGDTPHFWTRRSRCRQSPSIYQRPLFRTMAGLRRQFLDAAEFDKPAGGKHNPLKAIFADFPRPVTPPWLRSCDPLRRRSHSPCGTPPRSRTPRPGANGSGGFGPAQLGRLPVSDQPPASASC